MWSLRKRRFFACFAGVISKDKLHDIYSGKNEFPRLQKEELCYLLIHVRDDSAEDVSRLVGQTCDTLLKNGAVIEEMMSSIICAVFPSASVSVPVVIDNLFAELGQDVRIAHGRGEYLRGIFGSTQRFTYGTIIPNFSGSLAALFETPYGTPHDLATRRCSISAANPPLPPKI